VNKVCLLSPIIEPRKKRTEARRATQVLHGNHQTLYGLERAGSRRRSTINEAKPDVYTTTVVMDALASNELNVPVSAGQILAKVQRKSAKAGVPPELTKAKLCGESPSRAIAKRMRGMYKKSAWIELTTVTTRIRKMNCLP
jgi:hypothetical protein